MGMNYYWKKLPATLKLFEDEFKEDGRDTDILYHICKVNPGGKYCFKCGTTLCKPGTMYIYQDDVGWYDKCPICKEDGVDCIAVIWTCYRHKLLITHSDLLEDDFPNGENAIIDDDGNEYTLEYFHKTILNNLHGISSQSANRFR